MPEQRVLVVDDFPELTRVVTRELTGAGFAVDTATTGAEAIQAVEAGFEGVILLDLNLPDYQELQLFDKIRAIDTSNPIIIMTAHGSIDLAARATRAGAFDFITKEGNHAAKVRVSCKNAYQQLEMSQRIRILSDDMGARYRFESVVTGSPKMHQVLKMLEHATESRVTVLIQGESGTGKEVVARAIHYGGPRRDGPFIAINCAGIPDTLLESELFGYEKGAFTGANSRKQGRFELAHRGTIFLDEIGEMNPALQSKILRVLQERQFERLGGTQTIPVDVRIISATNRVLIEEVQQGRFREDLYYRLGVFQVTLPPLRERGDDVELLTSHFLRRFAKEEEKPIRYITKAAMQALRDHPFPGNVRQLQNVISHAVVVCEGDTIDLNELPSSFVREATGSDRARLSERQTYERLLSLVRTPDQIPRLQDLESAVIERALEVCDNNIVEAAQRLGLSRATLYRRMRQLEEQRERDSAGPPDDDEHIEITPLPLEPQVAMGNGTEP